MKEKVAKVGIRKNESYTYFVDQKGNISRYNKLDPKKFIEVVAKVGIKKDPNYHYYIDDYGDVSRKELTEAGEEESIKAEQEERLKQEVAKIREREFRFKTRQ